MENAFNAMLKLKQISITITRGVDSISSFMSPSNYDKNFENLGNVNFEMDQFVISAKDLTAPIDKMKRADRIETADGERFTVDTIKPLYGLGGKILGWRITTG